MVSKEDPVRNSAAVCGDIAPAVLEAVTGGKRKAEESSEAPAAVPAVGEVFVDKATGVKFVDMPESYLCWVLSQKRTTPSQYDPRECTLMSPEEIEQELATMERLEASLAGVEDRFFAFQAWVRETYETKGRVLVPVDSIPDAFTSSE